MASIKNICFMFAFAIFLCQVSAQMPKVIHDILFPPPFDKPVFAKKDDFHVGPPRNPYKSNDEFNGRYCEVHEVCLVRLLKVDSFVESAFRQKVDCVCPLGTVCISDDVKHGKIIGYTCEYNINNY